MLTAQIYWISLHTQFLLSIIHPLSFSPANIKAEMQPKLPDHQAIDLKKLKDSDSIKIYPNANAKRETVYHAPILLMVSPGTPA